MPLAPKRLVGRALDQCNEEPFAVTTAVDVLAIAAHPDDVELTCGGTLVKMGRAGYATGIVDLTRGETGTRGTAERRAQEATRAAQVMGIAVRLNAGLPDAHLHHTDETRRLVVELIRQLTPKTVILPYPIGRHPDHRIASELSRDACYLAGLANYDADGDIHRPTKILYALAYREDPVKPSFVVDISEEFDTKMAAVRSYASQFEGAMAAGEIFPTGQSLYDLIETQNAHYGSLIRTRYGEPFMTHETIKIDDVVSMGVQSL